MARGYVLVEGHGEVGAVGNLLSRLSPDLGIEVSWAPPIRWKNLHLASGVEKGAAYIRSKGDADALLSLHFPPNRSYKPTLDQLPLTRLLDFSDLRAADLACYGTLERALLHLARAAPGSAYPLP